MAGRPPIDLNQKVRDLLNPNLFDLRYVKRFLVETAHHTNARIGQREDVLP